MLDIAQKNQSNVDSRDSIFNHKAYVAIMRFSARRVRS
jgi:hypothetical protein